MIKHHIKPILCFNCYILSAILLLTVNFFRIILAMEMEDNVVVLYGAISSIVNKNKQQR